jgi:hypothetical protein
MVEAHGDFGPLQLPGKGGVYEVRHCRVRPPSRKGYDHGHDHYSLGRHGLDQKRQGHSQGRIVHAQRARGSVVHQQGCQHGGFQADSHEGYVNRREGYAHDGVADGQGSQNVGPACWETISFLHTRCE